MKKKILNNKRNILLILGIIAAIVIIALKIFSGNNEKKKFEIVKSSSKFYTVSNCISRYINYLSDQDIDNVLLLLDSSFKKKYKVTDKNLYNYINKLDDFYIFVPKKMYQEKINDDITKFYVKGYLSLDDLNYNNKGNPFYIIVYLNTKKMVYSIVPYDGSLFNDGGNK